MCLLKIFYIGLIIEIQYLVQHAWPTSTVVMKYVLNKDHQRMMVDPMFMIVQSLRSCLTAVTPTAVAPIAVILSVFTWSYLNLPEFTWIYLNWIKLTWNYLNFPEFTWIKINLPEFTLICLNLPEFTWIYLNLPEFIQIYLNLPEFTWIYLKLPEFT